MSLLFVATGDVDNGDLCKSGLRAGCVDLMREIQCRVHPAYHVFGHIHEGNVLK